MKKIFILLSIVSVTAFSQTGVDTNNPQGTLHVDGAGDNATTGTPTTAEAANDFIVTDTGDVGVGTITPQAKLDVNGTLLSNGLTNNGTTTISVVASDGSTFQDGAFNQNCTPQTQFNTATYFSLQSYGNGNNYCLPDPADVPGRLMIIRNIGASIIYLAASNGNASGGFCYSNDDNCVNFLPIYSDPDKTQGFSKTVMLISDGVNYTVMNDL